MVRFAGRTARAPRAPKERTVTDFDEMNRKVIKEFRENGGKVGGWFEGAPMLILHTTGRKSGKERENPLVYLERDGRVYVFASKAGAPDNPDWVHNLSADPSVTVEMGTERFPATAVAVPEPQRTEVYAEQAAKMENFAEYERNTSRTIPVVELQRA
jgi:deazaflavin-dependent oxidoreductase (nitroreductase family)